MLCFPDTNNLDYWRNLCNSYETVHIAGQEFIVTGINVVGLYCEGYFEVTLEPVLGEK